MKTETENIGQDSFLDIVANLVGILIILIMVVGAHAQSQWTHAQPNEDIWKEVEQLTDEVDRTSQVATSIKLENHELEDKIRRQAEMAASLDQKRHELLVQYTIAKDEFEKQQTASSEEEKEG